MKLFRLVWELVGSEFAGRHQQYEKFYAGASFIVRNHSYREAPWDEFHKYADDLLASYDIPGPLSAAEVCLTPRYRPTKLGE
jgi:4-hydroxyphenylacetate 3-monooxygenase